MNSDSQWDATGWREHGRNSQTPASTPRPMMDPRGMLHQPNSHPWDHTRQHTSALPQNIDNRGYYPVVPPRTPHQLVYTPQHIPDGFLRHTTPAPAATPYAPNDLASTSPPRANSTQSLLHPTATDETRPRRPHAQRSENGLALQIPKQSGM